MATALVIGDPHFKRSNAIETDKMTTAILKVARNQPLDFIVVLGDILHDHGIIYLSPFLRAVKFLSLLQEIAPTYTLIGNHDLRNNAQFLTQDHPFSSCKKWGPNMIVVELPLTATINGLKFTFTPYVPPGRFQEALDTLENWRDSVCIFGHQEFKGVKMGPFISTDGDCWSSDYPQVVCGHIHEYQEIQTNILYPGTPIQNNFGESDKTISLLTFDSSGITNHQRIDLNLTKKQIVRLSCQEVASYLPPAAQELKIFISGNPEQIKIIRRHPNIARWKERGYLVSFKNITTSVGVPVKTQRFTEALYDQIKADPLLVADFKKLFGSLAQ